INGLGYPFKNTIIVTISGVTNIIFHIILIPRWGYNGAAIAFLLNRVVRVTASHYYLNKIIGYKHNHKLLFGIFSAGIFLCGALLSAHTVFHKTGIYLMMVQYTFVSLVGIFLYFVLCIALNIASFNEIKRIGKILFKR
ncbi:MAG: polysaccharide biosynthesis C-terminal domain-containing protein, partial [Desulfobacterales bacterium]|nr:polysaccharide biosynthesis C-terminal domain-containing protein [Desulfobacterales bacterium]